MKRMKLQVILIGMLVMLCSALSLLAYTFFNIEKKSMPISAEGGGTASSEAPAQGVVSALAETNDGISLLAGEELLDALKFEMYAGSDPTADELIPASEYTVTKSDNTYTVTMTYSGSARYFFVRDYHSSKFTGKKVGSNISLYNSNDDGYVGTTVPANANTYGSALTLTLKAGFAWSDGSTDPLVFNYVVKPMVVDVPVLDKCEGGTGASDDPFYVNRVYDGENKSDTMTIMGYNEFAMTPKYSSYSHWTWDATGSKLVASNSLLRTQENGYPFRFALKSTSNFVWSTGDTADKYFHIISTVQPITLPELVGAELRDDGCYHLDVPYTGAIYSGKIYADDTYHVKSPSQPGSTSSHSGGYTNINFHDDPVKSYYTFDTTFTVTLTEGTDRWLYFNLYDTTNQCWADADGKPTTDTAQKTYIVHFVEREMNLPKLVGHDASNDFTKHVEYTGAPFTFTFDFDDTVIAAYARATPVQDRLTFTISYQGSYWASSDTVFAYDETPKKVTITITLSSYGMD
ncbi:MAG: hypothetical protein K2L87_00230, partial [Clostridiales bacterium]|nr:hypothetical protein [Clostridiales bacterium]